MPRVLAGESHGLGRDVDASGLEVGDVGMEEGIQEEGYAACSCAKVQDAECCWWGGVAGGEAVLYETD